MTRPLRRQRGMALLLTLTVAVLGIAWYAVGALAKAVQGDVEREVRTGENLRAAKQALLGYLAQHAARSDVAVPGQMPCPESVTLANPGYASPNCGNAAVAGRLPWRTLGMDEPRDGHGEPLWYALSAGFRAAPVNFSSIGQLPYNGAANAAVAFIIAPGPALRAGGCNTTDQMAVANRNTAPLVRANFLECGNAAGNYADAASAWNNDRIIAITAAEWADAIAPAVADRLQREVAPVFEQDWRFRADSTNEAFAQWGRHFMPYASSFGNPSANDLCGDAAGAGAPSEGLLPLARAATSACSRWQTGGANVSQYLLGLIAFSNANCSVVAAGLECPFAATSVYVPIVNLNLAGVSFTAIAPNVASSFRSRIDWSHVTFRRAVGGALLDCAPAGALTQSLSATTGSVTLSGDCIFTTLLLGTQVIMRIEHLPDAALFAALPAWFLDNQWEQHTYYALAPAASVRPGGTVCSAPALGGCITLNGLDASAGNADDKQFVLGLMGRRLAGQAAGSSALADYLESRTSATQFTAAVVTSANNDRLAACPSLVSPGC